MNKKNMKEYRIWKAMKARCHSTSQKNRYYFIDNIQVCERWEKSFDNFLKDMGPIPGEDYSIERIDYMKNYCPENCKWIKLSEQSKNRRSVLLYTYKGKTMILKDWAKYFNIKYTTLYNRIFRQKLSFSDAIKKDYYNRLIEINGEKKTITEWSKFFDLKVGNVLSRIHRGWSKKDALLKNQEKIKNNNKEEEK